MNLHVIACSVMTREISLLAATCENTLHLHFMEQELHNQPDELRKISQADAVKRFGRTGSLVAIAAASKSTGAARSRLTQAIYLLAEGRVGSVKALLSMGPMDPGALSDEDYELRFCILFE